ncbi:MAG: hypothetical protein KDC87_02385 [Planctomycetes bacterium]|nr:hypothetical protein [Planctomycetota bacterium]MCB9870059.1 hypothetical protein [Planctomycetota bacterium]MCB9889494.1 hypothetical protein [Planctomycetota bacterium]
MVREYAVDQRLDWAALAAQSLGTDQPERALQALRWHLDDDLELPPVCTRADLQGLPHIADGADRVLLHGRACVPRQRIDAADPELCGVLCADALADGTEQVLLRFDHLVRHGVDPGTLGDGDERDLFAFEAGFEGCAAYTNEAIQRALGPLDPTASVLALDPGAAAPAVATMLLECAAARGWSRDALQLELGADPIHDWVAGGRPIRGTPGEHVARVVRDSVDVLAAAPRTVPLAAHGHAFHRAGATPAQEIACVLASALAYARLLGPSHTANALCLRIPVHTELCVEVAKLRAVRLLWAKLAHALGLPSLDIAVHAEGSPRGQSSYDPHGNLLRSTLHAVAATLGGCDSIAVAPFDLRHDAQDRHTYRTARHQLLLLREESQLGRGHDPLRGAYTVEVLTDALARRAFALLQEIEAAGGMVEALQTGLVQQWINAAHLQRRERFHRRRRVLVGVNRFVDPRFERPSALPDSAGLCAAHAGYLERRSADQPTIGERVVRAYGKGTVELDPALFAFSPDGAVFEHLRDLVRPAGLRVLPVLAGPARVSRARGEFARDYFAAGGFEVLEPLQLDQSVDLERHRPHIVVACSDDAGQADLVARLHGSFLLVLAGRPRPELAERVQAFVYDGDDAYATLRALYCALTEQEDRP